MKPGVDICLPRGGRVGTLVGQDELRQRLFDMWRDECPKFDQLARAVQNGYEPTQQEQEVLDMSPDIVSHDTMTLDGTFFKTNRAAKAGARTNSSGVMMTYKNANDRTKTAYGVLVNIIEHRLCPRAPILVAYEAVWYKNRRLLHKGRMQVVQFDQNMNWNSGGAQFDKASVLAPQNVGFAPIDARNWDMKGELVAYKRRVQEHIDFGLGSDNVWAYVDDE